MTTAQTGAAARYGALVRRRILLLAGLGTLALAAFLADLMTGPSAIDLDMLLTALFDPEATSRANQVIVWNVRLPAALIALLVGAILSLAGAETQTILNNPLASPFTLGVEAAASFGAATAIVLGIGLPWIGENWMISANAFVFAFASTLLLQGVSKLRGRRPDTLILFGIAIFFTFNSLLALIQFLASQEALQQIVFWTMGSLARANWEKVGILCVVLAVLLPFSLSAAWKLTALRLGEDRARSFGINTARLRLTTLLRISLMTAAAVSFVGTIGFVGLVGPHIARLLTGEDHRFFLPASLLSGAIIMAGASIASKSLVPGILVPIGVVTSLIGIPIFIALVLARPERGG
ncbi:FecCD family ABC transporter permease [Amorphus sp. 3PC139-8]|uniref:FecCD family ABC transporter permease n=1 Tax=Amorphus sp. 3PC139-8 TaxID=2735676 RepID=UPI00345D1DDB